VVHSQIILYVFNMRVCVCYVWCECERVCCLCVFSVYCVRAVMADITGNTYCRIEHIISSITWLVDLAVKV
jgi:hypothetical protein